MRKVARLATIAGTIALVAVAVASATSRPPFPDSKLDLRSVDPAEVDVLDILVSANSGAITGTGQPPRVGPNIRVNAVQEGLPNGLFGRSETTLTISGQNVVAGWNDAQGFCGPPFGSPCTPQSPPGLSGYAYSSDRGATWTDGGSPDPFGGVLSRGDPWLDDNESTYYYANLAVNQATAASLGVGVWRGSFTGSSFAWSDVKTFDSPENATTPDFDFYDKEAIVVGKGKHSNDAYVSLTNFQGFDADDGCPVLPQFGFGQIEVWRTHNGGATWQGPAIAGPEAPDSLADCGFTGTLQQSSAPTIAPDGSLYVVWQYGPFFDASGGSGASAQIVIAKSTDGGATFGTPTVVANINSSRATPPIGYNRSRVNDHPRIEVSHSRKNKGRIWVTYYSAVSPVASATSPITAQSLVSIQVFAKYSDNGGASWSPAIPIPGDVGATGTKRWWPDVTIGIRGDVNIVYYEEKAVDLDPANAAECAIPIGGGLFRNGPHSSLLDTYWVFDKTGEGNFSDPIKVSEVTTNVCRTASNIRPNLGDYNDAEAFGEFKVGTTWAGGPELRPGESASRQHADRAYRHDLRGSEVPQLEQRESRREAGCDTRPRRLRPGARRRPGPGTRGARASGARGCP